jgi:hypothetical protein
MVVSGIHESVECTSDEINTFIKRKPEVMRSGKRQFRWHDYPEAGWHSEGISSTLTWIFMKYAGSF